MTIEKYVQWYKRGAVAGCRVAISSGLLGPLGPLCAAGRSGRSDHFGQHGVVACKGHGPLRDTCGEHDEHGLEWGIVAHQKCCPLRAPAVVRRPLP